MNTKDAIRHPRGANCRQRLLFTISGTLFAAIALASPEPVAIASVAQLHEIMITPASDALFKAESEAVRGDDAWVALGSNAMILAESANLLMTKGRALDNDSWLKIAAILRVAAADALAAARAKNKDRLVEANGAIADACERCHAPYRDGGRKM